MPASEVHSSSSNYGFVSNVFKLFLVILLGFSLLMSDPLDHDPKHRYNQTLVPTNIVLTRLTDSLHMDVKEFSMPTTLRVDKNKDDRAANFHSKVYKYIQDYVFHDDEDDMLKFTEMMGKRRISPMHITMILSGCYGNVWNNVFLANQINTTETSTGTFNFLPVYNEVNDEAKMNSKSWFVNVLLESLDNTDTHDRGICSCLKDFAAANVQQVDEMGKHTYDTCQTQNLQDYALNGEGVVVPTYDPENGDYIHIIPGFNETTTSTSRAYRNRNDGLVTQVATYFASVDPNNNLTLADVPDLYNLIFNVAANSINANNAFSAASFRIQRAQRACATHLIR